ncbi:hypothetical protein [Nocardioides montaniterrae]
MLSVSTVTHTARKLAGTAYIIGVAVVDKAEETIGVHPRQLKLPAHRKAAGDDATR